MLMVNSNYLKELNLVASCPWESGIWRAFSVFFFSLHSGCHNIPSVIFFFFLGFEHVES